jgi:hypothetical protein
VTELEARTAVRRRRLAVTVWRPLGTRVTLTFSNVCRGKQFDTRTKSGSFFVALARHISILVCEWRSVKGVARVVVRRRVAGDVRLGEGVDRNS